MQCKQQPNDLLNRLLCSSCRRNSSDGGAKAFQSAVTKVQAANALTGGALAHPEEQAQQPATEFEMEVAALDVGLQFVEVESPDANADKVGAPHRHAWQMYEQLRHYWRERSATKVPDGYVLGCAGKNASWFTGSQSWPTQHLCSHAGRLL